MANLVLVEQLALVVDGQEVVVVVGMVEIWEILMVEVVEVQGMYIQRRMPQIIQAVVC